MRRREFITFLGGAAAWPRAVWAQEGYQRFISFLIDLPGWTGAAPTGTEKEINGGRVISAHRNYIRGNAFFNVVIISGAGLQAGSGGMALFFSKRANGNAPATNARRVIKSINGFEVTTLLMPDYNFVGITITLGQRATFALMSNNIPDDEAMAIAQEFDWSGIKALIE
jgi:hypothetical protein